VTIDLDHVLSRNAPKDGTPPVLVEPVDPYPYMYVGLPDENALVMAVGTVGENPVPETDPALPPITTAVNPTSIVAGVPTVVTVTGTGFRQGDIIYQDEGFMPTTYVSETELSFTAEASAAGTVDVTVHGGGGVSNGQVITVTAAVGEEPAE
jgi:hypothetical protein